MLGGHGLTNSSYLHLNYTTHTLFKSSKVVFVMITSFFVNGQRITLADFSSASALCAGLSLFGLADRFTTPRFNTLGVACTVGSLVGGALCGALQQRVLQVTLLQCYP